MNNGSNSEIARPPELEDVLKLCESLNKIGARYILIGGFAVIFHGGLRTTKDIDLLVDASTENIRKIKQALSFLPDKAITQMTDDEVAQYSVVRVADEIVIDLMAKACGIDFETAQHEIQWVEVEGIKIPLASKTLLIKTKDTLRPSDKMDIALLRNMMKDEKRS